MAVWGPEAGCACGMHYPTHAQVPLNSFRGCAVLISARKSCRQTRCPQEARFRPWHMSHAHAHAMCARSMNSMYYYVSAFISMPHGMRRGSQPRVPENRRFRRSLERGAESPHACHDTCVACAQHSSYHERCSCSMACCARAHGARARPRYVSSPAAKKPGRRHRCRIGTCFYMQSSLHVISYRFLSACRIVCNMLEFQARTTQRSVHFS